MPKTNPVINFIKLASPTYRAAMPALLALVLPALALQGVAWTASRPALLAQCTPLRCAPLCLRQGGSGDHWVDFDDSGDECVVSDAGSSCLEADVSAPMPIDGLDRHPHRRSPGLQNNFYDVSTSQHHYNPLQNLIAFFADTAKSHPGAPIQKSCCLF